jgi:N-acetylglucosaminyldiphosphoundecaprenol N-acetyl-beta-D-mannosaminyltransferase
MPKTKTEANRAMLLHGSLLEPLDSFSASSVSRRRRRHLRLLSEFILFTCLDGGKRLFDLGVAGVTLVVLSPVIGALSVTNALKGAAITRCERLGRSGRTFYEYSFSWGFGKRLPALINVCRGDMSLIGPRAISPEDVSPRDQLAWRRFEARPGLVCLWWIRSRTNIGYGTETTSDVEYVDSRSYLGDLGIALRAIPASLYGERASRAPDQIHLLGVPINNVTMDDAVHCMVQKATGTTPAQVCFVNADCLNIACRDADYARILRECGFVLADGVGVMIAGKLLNRDIRQNVNGTDMLPRLCEAAETRQLGFYLLGGRPGVAAGVAQWMATRFPGLPVRGHHHGFFSSDELPAVLEEIRSAGAEILLVAFGAPKQEKWIHRHLNETGAKLILGVGGLFDFYSGSIPRAPGWIREIGMEWLYRLGQEPRRMWRRYFVGNVLFLARVLEERFKKS